MNQGKRFNPFYILLLVAGVAFAVTACAYGVMTVRQLQAGRIARLEPTESMAGGESFNQLVDRHGVQVMIVELVLLGVGTVGAIAYDQRLDRQQASEQTSESTEELA